MYSTADSVSGSHCAAVRSRADEREAQPAASLLPRQTRLIVAPYPPGEMSRRLYVIALIFIRGLGGQGDACPPKGVVGECHACGWMSNKQREWRAVARGDERGQSLLLSADSVASDLKGERISNNNDGPPSLFRVGPFRFQAQPPCAFSCRPLCSPAPARRRA